jgi:NADH-ubiquinone oxidoreductase chain 4
MRQTDLKSLIAYSSVAQMGIVVGGIITMGYWGVCRSFALMIAHGLCSSGLFVFLIFLMSVLVVVDCWLIGV